MAITEALVLQGAGIAVAAAGLGFGLWEYRKQGRQKRVEIFLRMRDRLKTDQRYLAIFSMIDANDPALPEHNYPDKRDLLGLFEEIALMMNSGLLRMSVAHYMFGSYVLDLWRCNAFWTGPELNRDGPYWRLFKGFAQTMQDIDKTDFARKAGTLRI